MDWERILLVFTDILLPLAAGYLLKIHNLMPQKACDWLIRFNVVVMVTVLLPLIGVLITAVPGVIGARCFAGQFDNELDRGAYVISAMLSNIGTIGGLCAFILYGEEGFAYVQLVAAPQNILMVAAAFPMAKYYYEKHHAAQRQAKLQLSFREMFITWNQVGILGMTAGILLQVFGVSRPPALGILFHNLVHVLAWEHAVAALCHCSRVVLPVVQIVVYRSGAAGLVAADGGDTGGHQLGDHRAAVQIKCRHNHCVLPADHGGFCTGGLSSVLFLYSLWRAFVNILCHALEFTQVSFFSPTFML